VAFFEHFGEVHAVALSAGQHAHFLALGWTLEGKRRDVLAHRHLKARASGPRIQEQKVSGTSNSSTIRQGKMKKLGKSFRCTKKRSTDVVLIQTAKKRGETKPTDQFVAELQNVFAF